MSLELNDAAPHSRSETHSEGSAAYVESHGSPESGNETGRLAIFSLAATVLTTLGVFGFFFLQGIVVARILGPVGRGEFGHALYFPRDILLYAGLLGGIEVVNSIASKRGSDVVPLKYAAARLGLVTGLITAVVALLLSVIFLVLVGKTYLIPFAALVCAFLPFEHMQLTISAVDRGNQRYARYNINRLIYAATFVVFALIGFGMDEVVASMNNMPEWLSGVAAMASRWTGFNHMVPAFISPLAFTCLLFVAARIVGLLPTLRDMKIYQRIRSGQSQSVKVDGVLDTRSLLRDGRPFAFSMVVSEVFDRLDVFLIMALAATMDLAGQYFVAVPAAALLIVAPNALGVFTFNIGADNTRTVTPKSAAVTMGLTIAFQTVATLIFALILPTLILSFYGAAYSPAIQFALWLLPASAIKGYLQAADGYLKGRNRPMIGIWSRLVSIVLMLLFVVCAYPHWDLLSIPMAACVGQALSMVIISAAVMKDVVERNRYMPLQEAV